MSAKKVRNSPCNEGHFPYSLKIILLTRERMSEHEYESRLQSLKPLITVFLVVIGSALLASCGGGGSTDPNATAQSVDDGTKTIQAVSGSTAVLGTSTGRAPVTLLTKIVPPQSSPVRGLAGIVGNAPDGTSIFLLHPSDENYTIQPRIVSSTSKTKGDPSNLVGKTFFEFIISPDDRSQVLVSSSEILSVYECDISSKSCLELPYGRINGGIIFDVKPNAFYALEK